MTASAASEDDASQLPRIGVVVPVRNGARWLPGLLVSLAQTDYPRGRVTVVVADHGSIDASADVARRAGAHVVAVTRGPVGAVRNVGARATDAPILAFVDADHEVGRDWLRSAAESLAAPGVGIVGDLCRAPENGTWVQLAFDRLRSRATTPRDVGWLGSGNMAVLRTVFNDVGGFDESLEVCEDVDLCRRVIERGWRIRTEPRMINVHLGDPATLGDVVRGELWRGRDNLRVSLRGRPTLRSLPGILMPVVGLAAIGGLAITVLAAPWWGVVPVLASAGLFLALVCVRTAVMVGGRPPSDALKLLHCMAVAAAYEFGRAVALVAAASHATRTGSQR
jgi:hypothetical protein